MRPLWCFRRIEKCREALAGKRKSRPIRSGQKSSRKLHDDSPPKSLIVLCEAQLNFPPRLPCPVTRLFSNKHVAGEGEKIAAVTCGRC